MGFLSRFRNDHIAAVETWYSCGGGWGIGVLALKCTNSIFLYCPEIEDDGCGRLRNAKEKSARWQHGGYKGMMCKNASDEKTM